MDLFHSPHRRGRVGPHRHHESNPFRTSNTDSSPINETADIFAPTLTLEETNTQKGYEDGFNAGFSLGIQEGYQVGLKHGFQVGEELGFYRGLVNVWPSAIRVDPDFLSVRIRRMVQRMLELLDKYPMLDPGNEGVDEIKTGLRNLVSQ
ncbi:hypothetical protein Dimus_019789 [Dionaea muscipula]